MLSCERRWSTRSSSLIGPPRLLEPVDEVVVAGLERLHVGRALLRRPRSMFRFVRMRSSQARRFVPGWKERQRPERARVGLLHQVLGLLARPDEVAGDSIDLVRESKCILLEPHAVACLGRDAACLSGSSGPVSLTGPTLARAPTSPGRRLFRFRSARAGTGARMEGYSVLTVDDEKVGEVVGTSGEHLVIERGTLRKHRHLLPLAFVESSDDERCVRTTLSKQMIEGSPETSDDDGHDVAEVARYYGLAGSEAEPQTEGYGVTDPDDPARTAVDDALAAGIEPADAQRARIRESSEPGSGDLDSISSPGLLGGDRRRDAD